MGFPVLVVRKGKTYSWWAGGKKGKVKNGVSCIKACVRALTARKVKKALAEKWAVAAVTRAES